jgi:hypothetical protein
MTTLEGLQESLRAALADAALTLTRELREQLELSRVPEWVLPAGVVTLKNAAVALVGQDRLIVSGSYAHSALGEIELKLELEQREGKVLVVPSFSLSAQVTLAGLVEQAGVRVAPAVARLLAAVRARAATLQRTEADALELSLVVESRAELGVGPVSIAFVATGAELSLEPLGLQRVEGTVSIGELELPAGLDLVGVPRLELDTRGVDVRALLSALRLPLPPLPPIPLLDRVAEELRVVIDEEDARVAGGFTLPGIGRATLAMAGVDAGAAFVAVVHVDAGFKFSSLHSALAPLDAVLDLVTFDSPALILSSVEAPAFPIPHGDQWRTLPVREGLELRGALRMKRLGLEFIARLIGMTELPFTVPLRPDLSAVRLAAAAPGELPLLPGILSVDGFRVSVAAEPLVVSASGQARMKLFDVDLPSQRLGMSVSDTGYALYLTAEQPWRKPLGLPIDIDALAIQIRGPTLTWGIAGSIALRERTIAVATEFVGEVPTFLALDVQGDLSFSALINDIVGADLLPAVFEPKLRNPELYIVLDPRGVTIAERSYPRGLAIKGRASFLGLEVDLQASVDTMRLQANGRLAKPIRLEPVLTITGAAGAATPTVAIDTAGDPVMTLHGRVKLLELEQELTAQVGTDAIRVTLHQSVGAVSVDLSAQLGHGRLLAEGTSSFQLRGSIGPLQVVRGGPSLGRIRLDTGVRAATTIDVAQQGAMRFAVTARVDVAGLGVQLPTIPLDAKSFEQLPAAVLRYLQENAVALLADLLGSADAWLRAVAAKLIDEVENAARVLHEHFRKAPEEIAKALRGTLNNTVEETAKALQSIGQGADDVAKALLSIGESATDVARVLDKLGHAPEVIGQALKAAGRQAEEVKNALVDAARVPVQVAEQIVGKLFGIGSGGGSPFVKIDTPFLKVGTPFVKVGRPFVKFRKPW